MKIIFLAHYFHPHIGGVEKHVYQLSQELTKLNHQITIITSHYLPELKSSEIQQDIQVIRIDLPDNNWIKPNKIQLWAWIIKHKSLFQSADIIHCHDVFFWYLPLRFLLPHKPVFTTFHGYEGIYPPSKKAIHIRKISEKISSGNICVGKFIEKWYGTTANQITYGATQIPNHLPKPQSQNSAILLGRLDYDNGTHL